MRGASAERESGAVRVLHVVHSFDTGGAERVVLELVNHATPGLVNTVCSLTGAGDLASRLDTARTRFVGIDKRPGNDPAAVRRLAALIDREAIDVVHCQGWGTYLETLVAAKMLAVHRCRVVFAFHGKGIDDVVKGVPWRRRFAQRLAFRFTDACIAPAAHMAAEYAGSIGLPAGSVRVIPNGIDVSRFACKDRALSRPAPEAGREFVVGFVGRLDPVKDVLGLAEIFARLCVHADREGRVARLLVIGDGSERSRLEEALARLGLAERATLTGMRRDVDACLSMMDAYVQPSRYEGQSLTLLEAMAAGLPVVTTAVGGTPEFVVPELTGFLHEPGDYDAFAASLLRLMRHPELGRDIGARARELVTTRYSREAMVSAYEALFQELHGRETHPCAA